MIKEINKDNVDLIDDILILKKDFLSSLNANPFAKFVVYIENGKVVGYIYYSDIYDRIEINQIEVLNDYRRKGYALKLMNYLLELNKPISLEVRCDNIAALSLYEKVGFKKVSERRGYYDGVDAFLMVLDRNINC